MASSTHQGDGWVTDPEAIRTIVMLKLLQPGDEVKLQKCEAYGIHTKYEQKVYRIHTPDSSVWNTSNWPDPEESAMGSSTPVALISSGYYIAYWNIAAWRRPLKGEA
jgi:hypothetical protein